MVVALTDKSWSALGLGLHMKPTPRFESNSQMKDLVVGITKNPPCLVLGLSLVINTQRDKSVLIIFVRTLYDI